MIIYECFDYVVEEIPYNYRATIKCARKISEQYRKIDRDVYCHPEHGLEHIKEIAERQIELWFKSGVPNPQPKFISTIVRGKSFATALLDHQRTQCVIK